MPWTASTTASASLGGGPARATRSAPPCTVTSSRAWNGSLREGSLAIVVLRPPARSAGSSWDTSMPFSMAWSGRSKYCFDGQRPGTGRMPSVLWLFDHAARRSASCLPFRLGLVTHRRLVTALFACSGSSIQRRFGLGAVGKAAAHHPGRHVVDRQLELLGRE